MSDPRAIAMLLLVLLAACPGGESAEEAVARAEDLMRRAGGRWSAGDPAGAAELVEDAYLIARDAPEADDPGVGMRRLGILASASAHIGERDPRFLGRAVRYSEAALAMAPDWSAPLFSLGSAYRLLRVPDLAADVLQQVLARSPGGAFGESVRRELAYALRDMAKVEMLRDRPGAAGRALGLLQRARSLADDPEAAEIIGDLEDRYARELEEAEGALARTIVHAEFGHLLAARRELAGVDPGQREQALLVRARMIEELAGNEEGLQEAEKLYRGMIARGSHLAEATEGLARLCYVRGRGVEGMELVKQFAEPTAEMRTVCLSILVDQLWEMPVGETEGARQTLMLVRAGLQSAISPLDRLYILPYAALGAYRHGRVDDCAGLVEMFRALAADDVRLTLLETRLAELHGEPIDPETRR